VGHYKGGMEERLCLVWPQLKEMCHVRPADPLGPSSLECLKLHRPSFDLEKFGSIAGLEGYQNMSTPSHRKLQGGLTCHLKIAHSGQ